MKEQEKIAESPHMRWSKARSEFPTIRKTRKASFVSKKNGQKIEYTWAPFEEYIKAIVPVLSKYDLVLTFPLKVMGTTHEDRYYLLSSNLLDARDGAILQSSEMMLSVNILDPQNFATLLSYYKRYLTDNLFATASEDEDGEVSAASEDFSQSKLAKTLSAAAGKVPSLEDDFAAMEEKQATLKKIAEILTAKSKELAPDGDGAAMQAAKAQLLTKHFRTEKWSEVTKRPGAELAMELELLQQKGQ